MFAYLRGTLERKAPGTAVVDVGGVGYQVQIPLSTFYELPEAGSPVLLRITTQLREDAIHLFGFRTEAEQTLFHHLIGVSGVGPRTALAVLSGMSVPEIAGALTARDVARLQSIPGIGRKTAERLVLELREKVAPLSAGGETAAPPPVEGVRQDVVSALVNLGYPSAQAERATGQAFTEAGEGASFEELLRATLRRLHR